MTNISEDRKVVLAPIREVPEEIVFLISEAKQDPNIPNRYWFDFPNQWANQPNKDPIIGIRSIYTTKTNRYIKYSYKVSIYDHINAPNNETVEAAVDVLEGTISHWLDGSDTIRVITENFNKHWITNGKRTSIVLDSRHSWKDYEILCYYGYDRQTHKTYLYFGRGIGETSYYEVVEEDNTSELLPYQVEITAISDDTIALFGGTEFVASRNSNKPCRIEIPIWSRYQCLVKSSISANDKNNILGHTRNDPYTPIKYYRLTSGVKKFWIELYETRYHDSPVSFPTKVYALDDEIKKEIDRDDLIIEAIVAFSAQGML